MGLYIFSPKRGSSQDDNAKLIVKSLKIGLIFRKRKPDRTLAFMIYYCPLLFLLLIINENGYSEGRKLGRRHTS